jgi:hypothetical protein
MKELGLGSRLSYSPSPSGGEGRGAGNCGLVAG